MKNPTIYENFRFRLVGPWPWRVTVNVRGPVLLVGYALGPIMLKFSALVSIFCSWVVSHLSKTPIGTNRSNPIIFASLTTLVISSCPSWLHTNPVTHSASKDRIPAPRVQQSHIFLYAASIFVPVYHAFWSLKHFTVHCLVGKTWVLWLWVIKGFSFPLHCFSREIEWVWLLPMSSAGNIQATTVNFQPQPWLFPFWLLPGPNFVPLWLALFIGINVSY